MHDAVSLLDAIARLAREAGRRVMAVYATDFAVQGKPDASPVTLADRQAEAVIVAGLRALTPDVPIVAEEAMAAGDAPMLAVGGRFWLVDPLDGTREFVARNVEFTINIALIEQGQPVLGVVLASAVGGPGGASTPASWTRGRGWKMPLGARPSIAARYRLRGSRCWPAARMAMPRRWTHFYTTTWPAARRHALAILVHR